MTAPTAHPMTSTIPDAPATRVGVERAVQPIDPFDLAARLATVVESEAPFVAWWAPDGGWSFVCTGQIDLSFRASASSSHPHVPIRVGALPFRPGAASVWGGWSTRGLVVPARSWCTSSAIDEHYLLDVDADARPVEVQRRAEWSPAMESRYAWCARVAAAEAACRHGGLNKVVLARAAARPAPVGRRYDVAATAAALRAAHPDAWVYALGDGAGRAFIGASPELLVRRDGARLRTHALAGTARADDAAALRGSMKDRREHAWVVDALRADLRPWARAIRVADAPRPRPAGPIVHLETPIEADPRPGATADRVAAALHPTPALGGHPRAAALAWLDAHEPLERGLYGAPVGWVAPNGDGVFAVAIRGALLDGARAWAFAGAGVVAGSDPAAEWRETTWKLQAIDACLVTR